jgi:predicted ATPase
MAFGRHRVRSALGAGGFGTVYLGDDTQLDRPAAIKVLRGGADVPHDEAERFLQEARRLARLSPGLIEKAIGYWLKAGLRSRERSAEIEAISHLTRGLALLETMDESLERDDRELELLSPLGTAYIASRGYAAPEVGPVFRRARELCQRAGQPLQLFAILLGIWEWHTVRGELCRCTELAAEGMEFAGQLNDPGLVMRGHRIEFTSR